MGTSLERRPLRDVIIKPILQESDMGKDVPDRRNIMCESPKTGKQWVFIRNKSDMATIQGRERSISGGQQCPDHARL